MSKRRRLAWTAPMFVVIVVCLAGWRTSRPHPVNQDNFQRIRIGMTQAEVEAILGCPPGDYSTTEREFAYCGVFLADRLVSYQVGDPTFLFRPGELEEGTMWTNNSACACVWFDEEGRVRFASFSELLPEKPRGPLDRLRGWLGW